MQAVNDRLWTVQDIADYLQLSRSTVYSNVICKPDFPASVRIGRQPQTRLDFYGMFRSCLLLGTRLSHNNSHQSLPRHTGGTTRKCPADGSAGQPVQAGLMRAYTGGTRTPGQR